MAATAATAAVTEWATSVGSPVVPAAAALQVAERAAVARAEAGAAAAAACWWLRRRGLQSAESPANMRFLPGGT